MSLIEIFGAIGVMVLSSFGTVLLLNFKELKDSFKQMAESVIQLNIKLERVIVDQVWHKEEIKEIKERLESLENKE